MPATMRRLLLALPLLIGLTACDQIQRQVLGEDPAAKAERQEAEGKAVGGACRHSGRAIEDCYAIYHWLQKAAIFAGWQEMDTYMRTNKIESVEPQLPPPQPPGTKRKLSAEESAKKPAARNGAKPDKPEKSEKPEKAEPVEKDAKPAAK
jgi:hypothetical protein